MPNVRLNQQAMEQPVKTLATHSMYNIEHSSAYLELCGPFITAEVATETLGKHIYRLKLLS